MYDILIIGSGPAGYVAAIRAAQLGLKVGCVEQSSIGGTCLNIGCIPSKSLLDSSYKHYQLEDQYSKHGIEIKDVSIDLKKMMSRKDEVVGQLTNGVSALFKSNKIDLIEGKAKIISDISIEVFKDGESHIYETKNIIIASGSSPAELNNINFSSNIVDSEGALKFEKIPKQLVVIGAGIIGLELGSVWARLGSKVTILEAQQEFLPMLDARMSRQILREFNRQGLDIRFGSNILDISDTTSGVEVRFQENGEDINLKAEKMIIAIGRKPNTQDLFNTDLVSVDDKGFIEVDEYCQTKTKSIWAIGDAVRGPMLAHKASEEGIMVSERIAGENFLINYAHIPNVIYTHPEVAWVGKNEKELKSLEVDYKSGSFPFAASGRALASGESTGSVTIHADNETDQILGIQVFGPSASEIMHQGLIAMDNEITSEKFSSTIFSHPTVSEALHEATLAINQKAIHIQNRKKKK
jgi:dihydrolipoamide dehydrogenase